MINIGEIKPLNKRKDKPMKFEEVYKQVGRDSQVDVIKIITCNLWEYADWRQEGMLSCNELLKSHPNLLEDHPRLYRYFAKTKFTKFSC